MTSSGRGTLGLKRRPPDVIGHMDLACRHGILEMVGNAGGWGGVRGGGGARLRRLRDGARTMVCLLVLGAAVGIGVIEAFTANERAIGDAPPSLGRGFPVLLGLELVRSKGAYPELCIRCRTGGEFLYTGTRTAWCLKARPTASGAAGEFGMRICCGRFALLLQSLPFVLAHTPFHNRIASHA